MESIVMVRQKLQNWDLKSLSIKAQTLVGRRQGLSFSVNTMCFCKNNGGYLSSLLQCPNQGLSLLEVEGSGRDWSMKACRWRILRRQITVVFPKRYSKDGVELARIYCHNWRFVQLERNNIAANDKYQIFSKPSNYLWNVWSNLSQNVFGYGCALCPGSLQCQTKKESPSEICSGVFYYSHCTLTTTKQLLL